MRTCRSAVAALALLGTSIPVQAIDAPLALEPSSKWVVNYADDSCRLIRTFGEGDQEIRLEFRMFAPEKYFWLLVSGAPLEPTPTGVVQIGSRFEPDDKDTDELALVGKLDEHTPAIMFSSSFETRNARRAASDAYRKDREAYLRSAPTFDTEREAQVTALEIKMDGRERMTLKLGAMRAPMDAVRACLDDLLDSWGVDAKVQKSLTRPPVPASDPAYWIKWSDFPSKMLAGRVSATVNFRLTVDASGAPTACDVLTMESAPEFIKATCDNLMKRARFKPALDAQGKPVASIFVDTVEWLA